MEFIYRIPLFQFDHENPEELEQNRPEILEAISLSSPEFSQELAKKPFAELEHKLKIKLRKYLLRGRFRPTPFGRFAGVGIGKWGANLKLETPFRITDLPSSEQSNTKSTLPGPYEGLYRLLPGISKKHGYYHATVWDGETDRWVDCKVQENSLLDELLEIPQPFDFQQFAGLLDIQEPGPSLEMAKHTWNDILATGLLTPEWLPRIPAGTDSVLSNPLELPKTAESILTQFTETAGHLFAPEGSNYVQAFIDWFAGSYDDRFVVLEDLLKEREFVSGHFLDRPTKSMDREDVLAALLCEKGGEKAIDLSRSFPKAPLQENIYDLQLLYRLDANRNPVIENMVCNRPFVYLGRFTRDPRIADYAGKVRDVIYPNQDILYAHVALRETAAIDHICDVRNLFDYEITPFASTSEKKLGLRDLWIGISGKRIVLVHKKSGFQVLPVILHPLNGNQVTHPVLRLLWETAHQNNYRFLPYQSKTLRDLPYCPRLNWGPVCLQPGKWTLKKESYPNRKSLQDRLDQLNAPQFLLAGNLDRELLINRFRPEDFTILWQELQRNGSISATEALWYPSDLFQSEKGVPLYPQFVYHSSKQQVIPKIGPVFNPLSDPRKDCLCFSIQAGHSDTGEVLERLLHQLNEWKFPNQKIPWYFLQYGKNGATEIRLRLLDIPHSRASRWLLRLGAFFISEGLTWKTTDYFPETRKYGITGLACSHKMFWLESAFLAGRNRDGTLNFHLPDLWKEDLTVWLWLTILRESQHAAALFRELRAQVLNMPVSETRALKKTYSPVEKPDLENFPIEEYLQTIANHEYFSAGTDQSGNLLFNHLHMMVNRFFPADTREREGRIRYRLYRELGRWMHTDKQAVGYPQPRQSDPHSSDQLLIH
ncbi:lantibiotic dehydratase [Algoriphagus terrigena]|uniref:lantibiotic dehydratase n=1 Tax=Algoriphagus terrigena TaxID=344884 RepID=UPI00040A5C34|nr:lantibiotic dehydratase [Algoriphagus terrigena]